MALPENAAAALLRIVLRVRIDTRHEEASIFAASV
jgi:hypothetical protein